MGAWVRWFPATIFAVPRALAERIAAATLAHRFYRRDGELLVGVRHGKLRRSSRGVVPGFFVLRRWLAPISLPPLALIEG